MFNLALISRSEEKLNKVRDECALIDNKVDVKVLPIDLAYCSGERYRQIFTDDLQGKQVSMLFNNAGKANFKYSLEADPSVLELMIRLNTYPMALLSSVAYTHFRKQLKVNPEQNFGLF